VVGELSERGVMAHLVALLRRFGQAGGARARGRVVPTGADRLGFVCVHPTRLAMLTGEVIDISESGLSFTPHDVELASHLKEGSQLSECSLRLGNQIVDLGCVLRRASLEPQEPSLGIEFAALPAAVSEQITGYLGARAERQLAQRLAADAATGAG
jgi:hypothetical protein